MLRSKKEVDRHVKEIFGKMISHTDVNRKLKGYNIARLYFNIKEYSSARRYLAEYLSVRPKSPEGHKLMGQIYEDQNEKKAALQSYKTSYEIMPSQKDLVLKICDLYAHVEEDINVVMYWIEIGEKHYPHQENISTLKQLILSKNSGQSKEELEAVYLGEITKSPQNMNFYMALLKLYIDWSITKAAKIKDAYYYILNLEQQELFPNSNLWYLRNLQVLQSYEKTSGSILDNRFDLFYLLILDRLISTSLVEGTNARLERNSSETHPLSHLISFDYKINKAIQKYGEGPYLKHMIGQNYFHFACLLSSLGQEVQESCNFNNIPILVGIMLLLAIHKEECQETELGFENIKRALTHRKIRISMAAHMLNRLVGNDKIQFLNKAKELAAIKGTRQYICSMIFDKESLPTGGYFMTNNSFSNTPLQFPSTDILFSSDKGMASSFPLSEKLTWNQTASEVADEDFNEIFEASFNMGSTSSVPVVGNNCVPRRQSSTPYQECSTPIMRRQLEQRRSPERLDSHIKMLMELQQKTLTALDEQNAQVKTQSEMILSMSQSRVQDLKESVAYYREAQSQSNINNLKPLQEIISPLNTKMNDLQIEVRAIATEISELRALVIVKEENYNREEHTESQVPLDVTNPALTSVHNYYAQPPVPGAAHLHSGIFSGAGLPFTPPVSQPSARYSFYCPPSNSSISPTPVVHQIPAQQMMSTTIPLPSTFRPGLQPVTGVTSSAPAMHSFQMPIPQFAYPSNAPSAVEIAMLLDKEEKVLTAECQSVSAVKKENIPTKGNNTDQVLEGGFPSVFNSGGNLFAKSSNDSKRFFETTRDTTEDVDDDDEDIDEYEPTLDFKPVIEMPDLVPLNSDEQNDDIMFEERAKIYRYDTDKKEWKERGVGLLKILKNKDIKKCRIIMRRDQTLKTCANHVINGDMKLLPMEMSDRAWLWFANDFADQELRLEKLGVRFKTDEMANNFKIEFDAAVKYASENSPTESIKPVPVTTCDIITSSSPLVKATKLTVKDDLVATSSIFGGFSVSSISTSASNFTFGSGTPTNKSNETDAPISSSSIFGSFSTAGIGLPDSGFNFGVKPDATEGSITTNKPPNLFFNAPSKPFFETTEDADDDEDIDEYEPTIDFKPVIEMPDLVPINSDEQNDDIMFEERAKIYRYDIAVKEWKERGVGLLKILKNKDIKKCRIIMRREQTLKTCANHVITADMKLLPMSTSDRAWLWFANDFADQELKSEKLSVRFKTDDMAKKFKVEFDAAVQYAAANSPTENNNTVASTTCDIITSSSPLVKDTKLTVKNDLVATSSIFGSFSVGSISSADSKFTFGSGTPTTKSNATDAPIPSSSIFASFSTAGISSPDTGLSLGVKPCASEGTTNNKAPSLLFNVPVSDFKSVFSSPFKDLTVETISSPATPVALKNDDCSSFQTPAPVTTSWVTAETPVPQMTSKEAVVSSHEKSYFDGSYSSQIGATKEDIASNYNVTSSQLMSESESSTVNLSLFASPKGAPQSSIFGGFTTPTISNKTVCTPNSIVGQQPKINMSNGVSSIFGGVTPTSATNVPESFKFSPITSGGMFKGQDNFQSFGNISSCTKNVTVDKQAFLAQPLFKSTTVEVNKDTQSGDESGTANEDYEPNIEFKPVIDLPALIVVQTGEQLDTVVFAERAKMYRYDDNIKEWKERGLGVLKISKNNDIGKFRIVMRRDQTLKTCANHVITGDMRLQPMETSERAWLWSASDYADGELKLEKLSVRFKTDELAKKFKTEFEAAVQFASEYSSAGTASTQNLTTRSSPLLMSFGNLTVKNEPVAPPSSSIMGGFSIDSISTSGSKFTFGLGSSTDKISAPKSTSSFGAFSNVGNVASPVNFSFGVKSGSSENDYLEFLYKKQATPEQVAKARELLLPDNFYLYEDLPPCSGCIGCENYGYYSESDVSDDGDDDEDEILFKETCTLFRKESIDWKFQATGDLTVSYNEDMYCMEVTFFSQQGRCIMHHEISMQTVFFDEGQFAFSWRAYDSNENCRIFYKAEFTEQESALELRQAFEYGKRNAEGIKFEDPPQQFYVDTFDGESFEG